MQVAVHHRGHRIVDAVAGVADGTTGRPVAPETLFFSFSTAIGMAAPDSSDLTSAGVPDCRTVGGDERLTLLLRRAGWRKARPLRIKPMVRLVYVTSCRGYVPLRARATPCSHDWVFGRRQTMARAAKWTVAVLLTVMTFALTLWVGALTYEAVLPKAWSDASKVGIVLGSASLLATIVFGIGKWWAERDRKQPPPTPARNQHITGPVIGGSGITGNIGGDAIIGPDPRRGGGAHG